MSRYGFDPSKYARWFLPFPAPLRPRNVGAFDNPTNCFGINLQWAALIVNAVETLCDQRTWEADEETFWFLKQQAGLIQSKLLQYQECPEPEPCPECPECPEPEPEPIPTNKPVGMFGYTIDELEMMVMGCINIAGLLKFENGKFYAKDDCCNWVLISGQTAPLLTTATQSGNAAKTLSDWITAGMSPLPEQPIVQHTNTLYTTLDSLRCAKATALVDALWQFLEMDVTLIESAEAGDPISTLLATAASYFTGIPSAVLLGWVNATRTAVLNMDAPAYASEVEAMLADDELKANIICILTDRVSAPVKVVNITGNKVTDSDIEALITTFEDVATPSQDLNLRSRSILVEFLAQKATADLDSIECGCDAKLPYGYTPPVSSEFYAIAKAARTRGSGSAVFGDYPGAFSPPDGTIQSAGTVKWGIGTLSSAQEMRFGFVAEFNVPVTITRVDIVTNSDINMSSFNGQVQWHNRASASLPWERAVTGFAWSGIAITGGAPNTQTFTNFPSAQGIRSVFVGGAANENVSGTPVANITSRIEISGVWPDETPFIAYLPLKT